MVVGETISGDDFNLMVEKTIKLNDYLNKRNINHNIFYYPNQATIFTFDKKINYFKRLWEPISVGDIIKLNKLDDDNKFYKLKQIPNDNVELFFASEKYNL